MAGFNAACCAVPESNPTADVSINERRGPHNQIPMAGIANDMIVLTFGASNMLKVEEEGEEGEEEEVVESCSFFPVIDIAFFVDDDDDDNDDDDCVLDGGGFKL